MMKLELDHYYKIVSHHRLGETKIIYGKLIGLATHKHLCVFAVNPRLSNGIREWYTTDEYILEEIDESEFILHSLLGD